MHSISMNKQQKHCFLLQPSIRPVPAQVILLLNGPPKLCIECHLVPLWAVPPKSFGKGAAMKCWREERRVNENL